MPLNEPQIICCNGCKRPIAVSYTPITFIMWCFDCAIDIEHVAQFIGIKETEIVIEILIEAQHNNIFKTCGFAYYEWQPKNDVTPEYSNESTMWGNDLTVNRCIAKLKTK